MTENPGRSSAQPDAPDMRRKCVENAAQNLSPRRPVSDIHCVMVKPSNTDLSLILELGEGQRTEFKERPARLDRELVAFANAAGGSIFLGVDDRGRVVGIVVERRAGCATRYARSG